MASFGNMLPRVHIHVMARFKDDDYFPNPMWGKKLREGKLQLPNEDKFFKELHMALSNQFSSLYSERRRADRRN